MLHRRHDSCSKSSDLKRTAAVIDTLQQEKNKATHICALAIGTALFSTQLFALNFTGASVNSG